MLVDFTSSGSGVLLDGSEARSASLLFSCTPTIHGHPQPSSQVHCPGLPLPLIVFQTILPQSCSSGLKRPAL